MGNPPSKFASQDYGETASLLSVSSSSSSHYYDAISTEQPQASSINNHQCFTPRWLQPKPPVLTVVAETEFSRNQFGYDQAPPTTSREHCGCHFGNRILSTSTSSAAKNGKRRHLQHPKGAQRSRAASCSETSLASSASSSAASETSRAPTSPRRSTSFDYTPVELQLPDDVATHASDMTRLSRPIWLVTTAALPWFTGTAVNPLLRAAYLVEERHREALQQEIASTEKAVVGPVHLVIPWLEVASDRADLYGPEWVDATSSDRQEEYLRQWLTNEAKLPLAAKVLHIHWYPARYHASLSSIFAMGDICERIEDKDCHDAVCILEEPEHVNFYRAPGLISWRRKFPHVVGIIHTNYKAYAKHHYSGLVTGPIVGALSAWIVRAYCDKVIKLSGVLQSYAPEKEVVSNVHGIRREFLDCPRPKRTHHHHEDEQPTLTGTYFIGKLLWAKGLDILLELQAVHKQQTGQYFAMDVFGSGPQREEIEKAYKEGPEAHAKAAVSSTSSSSWGLSLCSATADTNQQPDDGDNSLDAGRRTVEGEAMDTTLIATHSSRALPVQFRGRVDHARLSSQYKILVNPSVTEVLCTTTAEALAMGKFVVVPKHPSNAWFEDFPNCLQFSTPLEFVELLQFAQRHNPLPLTEELRNRLTWESATKRLYEASTVSVRAAARRERLGHKHWEDRICRLHYEIGKGQFPGDVLRKVLGAGPVANQVKYHHEKKNNKRASAADVGDDDDEEASAAGGGGACDVSSTESMMSCQL